MAACAAVKTVNAEPNPARTFIKGLLWPLFDNSLRESGALSNGGAHPEAMLAAWEEDKATPALEWNGDTRQVHVSPLGLESPNVSLLSPW